MQLFYVAFCSKVFILVEIQIGNEENCLLPYPRVRLL